MNRHNSIQSRAMLASLTISRWSATRTDKRVTEEVAQRNHVDAKRAGYYRKHAIDKDTPSLRAVTSAASALRTRHNYWTLPWGQDGSRILPAANFDKYSADMRMLRNEFDRAVSLFVADYPALAAQARSELGSLFDSADYPSDIQSKFACEVSIMPLPDAEDFRVDLPDDALVDIRANITRELEKTTAEAMKEPYTRLFEHVHRMVEKLRDPEGIFRDTLVTGLHEICDVLPGLNITGDEALDQFRQRAVEMIDGLDPDKLRKESDTRRSVADVASQIESDMAAFMGLGARS